MRIKADIIHIILNILAVYIPVNVLAVIILIVSIIIVIIIIINCTIARIFSDLILHLFGKQLAIMVEMGKSKN